ncbi:MAG: ABC transporter permease subunit [Bacteroidia bacterium]|nr:ABC transporter permease subunit [Bacteroidia bacterium]MCE7955078.1 ABC transporter permease [Bacteroidetes bacterium CHB6]HRV52030.1 ABC transporter permease subunit [Bacteroidia bacterium]
MNKIVKYVTIDILKSKVVLTYLIFLFLTCFGIFNLDNNTTKGILSLLNIILFIVPLVSLIYSTIYIFNSGEFIELLVAQPISRKKLITSIYAAVSLSLVTAFIVGAGIPVLIYSPDKIGLLFIITGALLTLIFTSLAFLGSVITRDKAKGIGMAIFIWLFFSILYDGILLLIMFQFSDYPIEKLIIVLSSFNPVDISRILILIHTDYSALMGYSGALFKEFLGSQKGSVVIFAILIAWIIIPAIAAIRKFIRKDF